MLKSSDALSPEFGLKMEKNPNANNSSSTKIPPRSSSTGSTSTDSKAKTGTESASNTHKHTLVMANFEGKVYICVFGTCGMVLFVSAEMT